MNHLAKIQKSLSVGSEKGVERTQDLNQKARVNFYLCHLKAKLQPHGCVCFHSQLIKTWPQYPGETQETKTEAVSAFTQCTIMKCYLLWLGRMLWEHIERVERIFCLGGIGMAFLGKGEETSEWKKSVFWVNVCLHMCVWTLVAQANRWARMIWSETT